MPPPPEIFHRDSHIGIVKVFRIMETAMRPSPKAISEYAEKSRYSCSM